MSRTAIVLSVVAVVVVGLGFAAYQAFVGALDPFVALYDDNCSVCHGENLEGTPLGMPLIGADLKHGDSVTEITKSIAEGFPVQGMPPWSQTLREAQIKSLAIYVAERRADRIFVDFKVDAPLVIPEEVIASEQHGFRMETVATDLDPLPYSIAPLPDGRILLTEKTRGLSIISTDGVQTELIQGTPNAYDDGFEIPIVSLEVGIGWMMDVAIHPNYEDNGWIYLHYGDRCSDCNALSHASGDAVSMNALVRGRIEDGTWVDEETIWRADIETYTPLPDMAAGGRISFDSDGYVFISVGMKGRSNYHGIQDLSLPYRNQYRPEP